MHAFFHKLFGISALAVVGSVLLVLLMKVAIMLGQHFAFLIGRI